MIIPVDKPHLFECRAISPIPDEVDGMVAARCAGKGCAQFRLLPLTVDAAWVKAVQQAAETMTDTTPNRVKAAAYVTQNREKFGLSSKPTTGFCGLAGKPEVLS